MRWRSSRQRWPPWTRKSCACCSSTHATGEPLVVEVVDGDGQPVADQTVTFSVRGGGGALDVVALPSAADGRAAANWTLGPNPGLNTAEASLANGSAVVFHALGLGQVEPALPPVVMAVWPPNAANIVTDDRWRALWEERPRLAVTFDQPMKLDQIKDPALVHEWLRMWRLEDHGEIVVRPLALEFLETADGFEGQPGFTAIYSLEIAEPFQDARYLLQIRAENDNIVSDEAMPLLLDADFRGTRLDDAQLEEVWKIEEEQIFGARDLWDALVDTGNTLPRSGDGVEGGIFHAWFEVMAQ